MTVPTIWLQRILLGLTLSLTLSAPSASAQSVAEMMEDILDKNTYIGGTSPGFYEAQTRSVMTLGSFTYRAPQQTYSLASYTLPKVSAGCGGIDMFFGSFSFISLDQLKDLSRNIVQNAAGYAFKLAFNEICSTCESMVSDLQDTMDDFNLQNIDSCRQAQKMVDSIAGKLQSRTETSCVQSKVESGEASDTLEAKKICGEDGEAEAEADNPVPLNYTWEALKTTFPGSDETRELLMHMVGTIVLNVTSDNSTELSQRPARAFDDGIMHVFLYGGSIAIPACDEPIRCLSSSGTRTVTVLSEDAFVTQVADLLDGIVAKLDPTSTSPYTAEEISFIERQSTPVLSTLREAYDGSPQSAAALAQQLAGLTATDILLDFIDQMAKLTAEGSSQLSEQPDALLVQHTENLRVNRELVLEYRARLAREFQLAHQQLELRLRLQAAALANVNSHIGSYER